MRGDPTAAARVQGRLPDRLRRRTLPLPGTPPRRLRIPAEAGTGLRAGLLPYPHPSGRDAGRSGARRPGRAIRGAAAKRRVLAGRAPRADPAGERGARADRLRPVQPRHRGPAHVELRNDQDACPRHLPRRRRGGGPAGGDLPLTRLGLTDPVHEARLLARIIETISTGLDLEEILQGIAALITETTRTDVCFVYLLDEAGQQLVLGGATPPFHRMAGQVQLKMGEGVSGWVAAHGRPAVIVEDKLYDQRYKHIPALGREDLTSKASVPIIGKPHRLVGVLNVHTRERREFTDADVQLLGWVAGLIAGAIENARLH